jgi:CBS domain containing-hemolysin-like protein
VNEWLFVGIGVLLTIGTGFFVASEFSLVSLDRADLEARRDAGEGGFTLAIRALKRTSTHLSSAQLGITLTTLLTGWLMEPAISSLLTPVLTGWGLSAGVAAVVAIVAAIGTLAARHPQRGLYPLYLERIAHYRAHPPGPGWDGVTSFDTK